MCFIKKTKLDCFNNRLAKSFWGGGDVEWSTSNSEGAAGGMVILWKIGSMTINYSLRGQGYVGINILRDGVYINLVNFYAPCNVNSSRGLWNILVEKRLKYRNEE